jgi:hypothetical protein
MAVRLTMDAGAMEKYKWPDRCVSCAAVLGDGDGTTRKVGVDKRITTLFVSSEWQCSVRLCRGCGLRVTRAAKFTRFIWWMTGINLAVDVMQGPMPSGGRDLSSGLVWLGLFMAWSGWSWQRRIVGMRILRSSRKEYSVWFENEDVADRFIELNHLADVD